MSAPSIPTRRIGDLEISAVGLGCMGMSLAYGPADRTESLATLNHALDIGVNFLDTADMYGNGNNEALLAEVLGSRRDEVALATKFGIVTDPDTSMPIGINGSAGYVREAADASPARLGVDVIDLYYLHRVDPATPIEETVGAMAELVTAGKVRHLGRGLLTGSSAASSGLAADDFRRTLPRWQEEHLQANLRLVRRIQEIARELDATGSQVALAWLLAQGDDVVPIPGTKRRGYLDENLGAVRVELPSAVSEELSAMRSSGTRYPDMDWVRGDSVAAG